MIAKGRKGMSVGALGGIAIALVVAVIIIAFGAIITSELKTAVTDTDVNYTNAATNVADAGISGMSIFGEWIPTIALIVVFAVILGIVITYMAKGTQQ